MINDILEELKLEITSKKNLDPKYLKSKGNANGFEDLVKDKIINEFNQKAKVLFPKHNIQLVGQFGKHFPDLELHLDNDLYGIELKSRQDGTWKTLGGSVIESISADPYKEIYLLFASYNKKANETSFHVRYAPYWRVASAIRVTHNPRFNIDLDTTTPVFKSNQEYKDMRNMTDSQKNTFIQKTLALNTSKSTWYSNPNQIIEPTLFSSLTKSQKDNLVGESLFLFPKDFLQLPNGNFDNATNYFLSEYYVTSASMRDKFTAGGCLKLNGISFPHVIKKYQEYSSKLIEIASTKNSEFIQLAYTYWKWPKSTAKTDLLCDFKSILDDMGDQYYKDQLSHTNYSSLSQLIFKI